MSGIYIHIPYCRKACHYCNFHFSTTLSSKTKLVDAILAEIDLQKDYLKDKNLTSIYFGGGTPSVLSIQELEQIFEKLSTIYTWGEKTEITFECNPDDLTLDYLLALSQTDINRLSIGVQSFDEDELTYMNRSHNAEQSVKSIKLAQKLFSNITIDLIYGSHKTSISKWIRNIETALSFDLPHISSYALTIEEKTPFGNWLNKKKIQPVDEGLASEQFSTLIETLKTKGYDHYEISNFGKPGHYAIHNTNYWRGVDYLGLGPGAHSFNGVSRSWNIANNPKYIESINQGILNNETEILTSQDQYNEYILTGLRTMWGVDKNEISSRFGTQYLVHFENLLHSKQIQKGTIKEHGNKVVLTEAGKHFADRIAATLFY